MKLGWIASLALSLNIAASSEAEPTDTLHALSNNSAVLEELVKDSTILWSARFASAGRNYAPPRLLFIRRPRGHPGGGSGYNAGLVIVDRREIDDISAIFKPDARSVSTLMIAHEIAHHVQHVVSGYRAGSTRSKIEYELQADCAAGWTMASIQHRRADSAARSFHDAVAVERQLPRLIAALNQLNGNITIRGPAIASSEHGTIDQRVAALQKGLQAAEISACGAEVTP